MLLYQPYRRMLPAKQARLLLLWDELGIPHESRKQEWGEVLTAIGLLVDGRAHTMSISMNSESREMLLKEIAEFCSRKRRTLREFQCLAGYMNWALNAYPRLRPGLASLYEKISGKGDDSMKVLWVSKRIKRDLTWFAGHVSISTGVLLINSVCWIESEADLIIHGDACLTGLGFYSLGKMMGFYSRFPSYVQSHPIFYLEELTVICAIRWASTLFPKPHRLVIYTDSENTAAIFQSFRAKGIYNTLLRYAVDILEESCIDLRVIWIPGKSNDVADALSRGHLDYAARACRGLQIHEQPWSREKQVYERNIALGFALTPGSSDNYNSAIKSWLNFAKLHEYSTEPNADTLSFYTVWMCQYVDPKTVDSYISGVFSKLEMYFPEIRGLRKSVLVFRTLRGCKRLYGKPVQRKLPMMTDDLIHLVQSFGNLSLLSHDDKLFLALITTGFYSLQRLGELTQPDHTSHRDSRKLPMRTTLKVFPTHFEYLLPASKSDPLFEGNRIVVQSIAAYRLFLSYAASRDALFPFLPHLWLDSLGRVPTRKWFVSRLRNFFPPSISGHSMRCGGATALAIAGVPDERIQAIGRWSSDAFKMYIRKNGVLLQSLIWGRPIFQ